mgnify:CR=1 FL=1
MIFSVISVISSIIFLITLLVVLFFSAVIIHPNISQRVLHRPISRIYSFHLVLQTVVLGMAIFSGIFWAFSRTSCGGMDGPCHSYIGQGLQGGVLILLGFPGFIATWRRNRWLVYE